MVSDEASAGGMWHSGVPAVTRLVSYAQERKKDQPDLELLVDNGTKVPIKARGVPLTVECWGTLGYEHDFESKQKVSTPRRANLFRPSWTHAVDRVAI